MFVSILGIEVDGYCKYSLIDGLCIVCINVCELLHYFLLTFNNILCLIMIKALTKCLNRCKPVRPAMANTLSPSRQTWNKYKPNSSSCIPTPPIFVTPIFHTFSFDFCCKNNSVLSKIIHISYVLLHTYIICEEARNRFWCGSSYVTVDEVLPMPASRWIMFCFLPIYLFLSIYGNILPIINQI